MIFWVKSKFHGYELNVSKGKSHRVNTSYSLGRDCIIAFCLIQTSKRTVSKGRFAAAKVKPQVTGLKPWFILKDYIEPSYYNTMTDYSIEDEKFWSSKSK